MIPSTHAKITTYTYFCCSLFLLVFDIKKDHTIHSYLLNFFHLIYVGDHFLTAR